jgi:ACS family D-galactonate transporter-like MFS transporter
MSITAPVPTGLSRLWDRQLAHYPDKGRRSAYLGITVLATITLYYELYVQGAVATKIIPAFGFTFTEFVYVSVVGALVGAFASLGAGLADRFGRANLVVGGLLVTALLVGFALPAADSKTAYLVIFALVSLVEGMALVATPALIRDFSPQIGRGAAMGFWTLGPVLGSLLLTQVSSRTLDSHPGWEWQFQVAGVLGLAVWVLALVGLRELSPSLRDQLMVSHQDRALIEARAAGIDPERALEGHWRQMLCVDIIGSALAVSLYLLFYYVLVGFIVVYFSTVYGYSEADSNALANWFWAPNAITLIVAGLLSDRLRVRKPFMLVGALISMVGIGLFALAATEPATSTGDLRFYLILAAVGQGFAYVAWMASFTETVEKHNPAATATGLAVWGYTIRVVVTAAFAILPFAVPAASTLVNHGPRLEEIIATYPDQMQVLQAVDQPTLAALQANPGDPAAQVAAVSQLTGMPEAEVAKVVTLGSTYAAELETAAAVDPAVLGTLAADPTNADAGAEAVGQIAKGLGVSAEEAVPRLQALAGVPSADLSFLQTNGPAVQGAGARLQSVSEIPAADLTYLSENAADVQQAVRDNPRQWQRWWWICLLGQLLFLPCVLILTGRWSPKKARQDELEHERLVDAELALLEPTRQRENA